MDPRAAQLIDRLALTPHPEGGHFGEVYRSATRVQPPENREQQPVSIAPARFTPSLTLAALGLTVD